MYAALFNATLSERGAKRLAIAAVIAFLVFAQIANLILPSYYSYDFNNMVDIADGLVAGVDISLAVISGLINLLSLPVVTAMVQITGASMFFYMVSSRRLVITAGAALFGLALLTPLALVRPQKELLVLFLTACCTWAIGRSKKPLIALAISIGAYSVYTLVSLRPYYVLITLMIPVLFFFGKLSPRAKLATVAVVFVAGFFLPSTGFETLRLARDAVTDFRLLFSDMEGNRTAFSNPSESATWIGFLTNYGAAIIRLNLPLLYWQTANEVALTLFSGIGFYFIFRGFASHSWRAKMAAQLLMAHVMVLWIFEPDLGSYLRHFSSCILYLVPIFRDVEAQALTVVDETEPGSV